MARMLMARTDRTDEELEDIRRIVSSFFEAWNSRDIPKIASVFSEDAEVVNSLGLWWSGLTDITRGLGAMNAIGPSLTPDSMSARLVADDAALCVVVYTVASFTRVGGQVIPEQKAISIFFMVDRGRGWLVAGAQTTAVNVEVIAQLKSRGTSGV
jgi:uncharacterized protein (TIGR02246 family)